MSSDEFEAIYRRMRTAILQGDEVLADQCRRELEARRAFSVSKFDLESLIAARDWKLPFFVTTVLGRNQVELGRVERSNCMTAVLSFHSRSADWTPVRPLEFFEILKHRFQQISPTLPSEIGDLIVAWSRSNSAPVAASIEIARMNPSDPDFPYGLVFDHVVVRLDDEFVFHKPDPTLESRYQIDRLEAAFLPTATVPGFELTYHRPRFRMDVSFKSKE